MTAPLGPPASDELLVADHGNVRVLTLNRPSSLNAVTFGLGRRFREAFTAADADPSVRAIIITGSGERAFCAGGDLNELATRGASSGRGTRVVTHMVRERITTPVIAAVNGLAFGGGLELVLACDLAVSGDHARFALPEVRHGVLAAGGGMVRLPGIVGPRRALQLLLTGEPIDAATALEWGLVNQVVRPHEVLAAALGLASSITAGAPLAVRASKTVVYDCAGMTEPEAWTLSNARYDEIANTEDAHEGPRAFAERRSPEWTGH